MTGPALPAANAAAPPSPAAATDGGDLDNGEITFVESFRSTLMDGEYEILVGHRVAKVVPRSKKGEVGVPDAGPGAFDETYVSRQRIRVEGPRYTLPPGMDCAHFPPIEGSGEYEAVLPHVVLRRRTLPWERTPSADGADDGSPWLALLVFHASDVPAGAPLPWEPRAGSVAELLAGDAAGIVTYPGFGLEGDETAQDRCQLIDIPAALWTRVAPRAEELRWLAHAREVRNPGVEAVSSYSVVIGNRLPLPNERCTAHLVSIEGLRQRLPGGPEAPSSGVVRLVSLASWSFTSQDPLQTFIGSVGKLSVGALRLPAMALPPVPGPGGDAQRRVTQAFDLGYAAKSHHTRAGDRTVSWYRGPLRPFVAAPHALPVIAPGVPVHTADALLRYDPDTGLFDTSYAVAWQTGRLLMLQNTSVALALAAWKHGNLLQAAVAFERDALERTLEPLALDELAASTTGHVQTLHHAGAALVGGLKFSEPPPAADPQATATRAGYHGVAAMPDLAKHLGDPDFWSYCGCAQPLPPTVMAWLQRLRLLCGVPANCLVGDMGSLPLESLRVFEVDANWVAALVDGAFSIGRSSQAVAAHDAVHHGSFHDTRPAAADAAAARPPQPTSGCLLHSRVVAEWPRLELRARDAAGQRLRALRSEHLTPRILLCLFEGTVAQVEIREPAEGLHFGFEAAAADGGRRSYVKPLRSLDAAAAGAKLPVPFRDPDQRVVDIGALAAAIAAALPEPFTTAEFALEMVEGVQSVRFAAPGARA